jgi:hypothetical protein
LSKEEFEAVTRKVAGGKGGGDAASAKTLPAVNKAVTASARGTMILRIPNARVVTIYPLFSCVWSVSPV